MTNTTKTPDKVRWVQELRRSNASRAIPSRRCRREGSRKTASRNAIRRSREGN